jgi:glutathione gamma-glutamylcysteinyltransferase
LNQTGTGHFEPLAAYNSKRDMVLLLDVAKFKYESHWCSLTTLYEAFKAIDPTSKISRGFLINSKEEVE